MDGTNIDMNALPAMVTLTIARWNQVLEMLGDHPWKIANPAIVEIHRQLQVSVDANGERPQPRLHLADTDNG